MCDYQKSMIKARVAEILDDYLMDPEEAFAEITLKFLRSDGQKQEKCLRWTHPDMGEKMPAKVFSVADLMKLSPAEVAEADSYYWNKANEIISMRNTER